MERLTTRNRDGTVGVGHPLKYYNYEDIKNILNKLAAYEDTGLMPDEIAALQSELTALRTELATLAIETVNREITLAKLEAEVKIAARVAEERDAYKEMADGLRRERDNYKCYFEDMTSKPDCNTCADKDCQYKPRLGHTVRANCPLWRGTAREW